MSRRTAPPLAVNKSREIIGIIPKLPSGKEWTAEIRARYAGSPKPLKDARAIAGSFKLTAA